MKPVDQTKFGKEGNCLQACIASIFKLPLDEVPDFAKIGGDENWWKELNKFLLPYGLYHLEVQNISECPIVGYQLIYGRTVRGKHAVVGSNGEMVHDPHPSRSGLDITESLGLFVSVMGCIPQKGEKL